MTKWVNLRRLCLLFFLGGWRGGGLGINDCFLLMVWIDMDGNMVFSHVFLSYMFIWFLTRLLVFYSDTPLKINMSPENYIIVRRCISS